MGVGVACMCTCVVHVAVCYVFGCVHCVCIVCTCAVRECVYILMWAVCFE